METPEMDNHEGNVKIINTDLNYSFYFIIGGFLFGKEKRFNRKYIW